MASRDINQSFDTAMLATINSMVILSIGDSILAVVLFGMLIFWKLPPWMIVIAGALGGTLIPYIRV